MNKDSHPFHALRQCPFSIMIKNQFHDKKRRKKKKKEKLVHKTIELNGFIFIYLFLLPGP